MFKEIPWKLIEREKEAKKIIQTLRDLYGDLSDLLNFVRISEIARENKLISKEEESLIWQFRMLRHEI